MHVSGTTELGDLLGVRYGDVILAVDGVRIDGTTDWWKILDAARSKTVLVVGIEREGKPAKLTYRVVP
jgi:S1-C subfamily serine protease